ncbi:hypothetical protein PHYSODRAFT_305902 [Phytophthora sojae]|uniref:Uncharacterized protein n=1 Tax=Phytophthora sojae (strain P6497) TaxID=1094619 RepID=G5A759_PHYSP|nr:hypothetical protein PHYSODRAFT_305902 [Phytophthora sojae]EGZ09164.1 hypothetical protein PHYSODRAFT_305902 [Phytophthora sojae]|eukprot:XP_009535797.1 hypothetical protein PHYSODRAFT_305902 [Phytophthora sojae]
MDSYSSSRPGHAVLVCWLLRLLELVFKVSAAGEEIMYIESTAWVLVQAATRILQHRYVRDKHNQASVLRDVFGGELHDRDRCFPRRGGQPSASGRASRTRTVRLQGAEEGEVDEAAVGSLMLHEILVYLDTSVDEQCSLQPETDVLSYESPVETLKKFTNELGPFICGKGVISEKDQETIQTRAQQGDLGHYGRVKWRWCLPFIGSTPEHIIKRAETRLLFHLSRMGLMFPFLDDGEQSKKELLLFHPSHIGLMRQAFYMVAKEEDFEPYLFERRNPPAGHPGDQSRQYSPSTRGAQTLLVY